MAEPHVYFHMRFAAPDRSSQLGGPKVVVQHAEILNEHGLPASIVFQHRWPWARSRDPLFVSEREFRHSVRPEDLVVLPGRLASETHQIPGRRKVIFTQLAQDTLAGFPFNRDGPYPWHRDELEGILAVSDHNADLMRLADPGCPVMVTYNSIELDDFPFRPWSEKKDLVAINWLNRERKNPRHTRMLLNTLRSRSAARGTPFDEYRVQVIQGLSDEDLQNTLADARLFFFLSSDEGLGLLPLEAMAAGAVVIGYDIEPMNEFLPPEYRRPWGDIAGLVEIAESVIDPARGEEWARHTRQARKVAERYSRERQVESVLSAYGQLLG